MYRLTYGKFAGMTLEHTILKSPSEVYARGGCAIRELERKPHLYELVREFRRLRKLPKPQYWMSGRALFTAPNWHSASTTRNVART